MINTQTQIDSLIDLAVIQRTELKQLIESLPQLRDHLSSEIERNLEEIEPAIRSELEQFVAARALDTQAKTSAELGAKLDAMARNLESTTAAKYSVLMAERAENANLLAKAEARIEDAASMLSHAVKEIVTDELSRFPRAGEIDQLRKEFAEPRGLNPRGRWQVGETYNKLDLVSYNGDSYVSSTDGNREKPSRSSEAWTLSAARGNGGGGGVTSMTDLVPVPANGELLIGNGSAFVNATLTAGTGISISNGPGSITINATDGNITLDDGTAAAPSLNFTSDTNTGLYRPAADTVGIVGGGHDIVRLTDVASATDYLEIKNAIGVATPLHVLASGPSTNIGLHLQPKGSGLITISDGTDFNKGIRFRSSSSATSAITLLDAVSTAGRVITLPDATDTLVGKATTDTLTNKTLTSPTLTTPISATLTAPASTNLTLSGGSTGASLVLGSGTTSPYLQLRAAGRFAVNAIASNDSYIEYVGNAGTAGTTSVVVGQSAGGLGIIYNRSNAALTFGTNSLERGRFTETGNLLIGTTTDMSGSGGLKVAGTTSASTSLTGAVLIGNGTAATNVGIGGGNVNAGGTITAGGNITTGADVNFPAGGYGLSYGVGSRQLEVVPGAIKIVSTTASTGVGTGALQVAGGIYAGAASVFGGAVILSAGTLTTTNAAATQGIFKGWNSRSGANAQNGQIELGSGLRLMGDASGTGGSIIDDRWDNAASSIQFRLRGDGTPVTALTLTGTGAATFAGAVTAAGDITSSASAATFLRLTSTNNNAAPGVVYTSGNGGSLQVWLAGSNVSGASGEFAIRDSTAGATALTITKSALAATFAGAVAIGNTTAAAVAAPSTHKVSILIGGVQYYLLASNV